MAAVMATVRDIDLSRLEELEKQAALFGPHTEPAVLIEIQTIRSKYPDAPRSTQDWRGRQERSSFDYSILMNSVGAALVRIRGLEERAVHDAAGREERQEKLDDQLDIIRDSTLANGVHLENLVRWLIGVGVIAVLGL